MPFIDNNGTPLQISDAEFVKYLFRDFNTVAAEMLKYGIVASLGGDGLIKWIQQQTQEPVTAADIRASELLKRLDMTKPLLGAEIGVFAADMSRRVLSMDNIKLIMVDSWACNPVGDYADSKDFHATLTQEQQDNYYKMACDAVKFAGTRADVVRMSSLEAAEKVVADDSLDFVFIDADHSYKGCKEDLEAWWPKVKKGGLFSGHDYNNVDYPEFGVTEAVDEFAKENDLTVELGDNFTWFIRK